MAIGFTTGTVYFDNENTDGAAEEGSSVSTSVGAKVTMEVQLDLTGTVSTGGAWTLAEATRWYFNPALFMPAGSVWPSSLPPPKYWYLELPKSPPNAGYQMQLVNCGQYTSQNENVSASIEVRGATTVILRLAFRMTQDLINFIDGLGKENWNRFLKSAVGAPQQLTNTVGSVYKLDRAFSMWLRCTTLTHTDPADIVTINTGFDFTSRWYDSGLYGGGPDLEDWECELQRGGVIVNDFSAFEPTKVTCRWTQPGTITAQDAYVYLCEVQDQNYVDFLTDYHAVGFTVVTDAFATQYDTHAFGPSSALQDVGGGLLETSFHVRNVDPTKKYAVVVVVGMSKEASYDRTNSFIRYPILADGVPYENTLLECTGSISDYNRTEADHVISTVVDRLRVRAEFDYTNYEAELPSWSNGSFLDDMERLKLEVFVDGTLLYDVLWQKNASNGFDDGYNAVFDIDDGVEKLRIDYTALLAYMNELAGLPDWGGKTITYKWTLRLSYDALPTHSVDYTYEQKVVVQDFKNYTEVVEAINLFNYDTGLPLAGLCGVDKVLVEVLLDPAQLEGLEWDISAFAARYPYGYEPASGPLSTEMKHGYASPVGLPDGGSIKLQSVSDGFTSNRATFVFDVSGIADGEKWRVYAVVRPQPEGS